MVRERRGRGRRGTLGGGSRGRKGPFTGDFIEGPSEILVKFLLRDGEGGGIHALEEADDAHEIGEVVTGLALQFGRVPEPGDVLYITDQLFHIGFEDDIDEDGKEFVGSGIWTFHVPEEAKDDNACIEYTNELISWGPIAVDFEEF